MIAVLPLAACSDLFEPAKENIQDLSTTLNDPAKADGVLGNAYILLPYYSYSSGPVTDVATDDAVTNDLDNSYLKMASAGTWSSNNDPMTQWTKRKAAIQYINQFLSVVDNVTWATDAGLNKLFCDRLKGEAYGLRALNMYYLLLAHSGWTDDGQLLGVPIITEAESASSDFNKPRNTFQECIDQIMSDTENALDLLPLDYADVKTMDEVPAKYKEYCSDDASYFNRPLGNSASGRMSGRIVEAIRAQVALLAASPAYADGSDMTMAKAADEAATVLDRIGGVAGLSSTGLEYYAKANVDKAEGATNPDEIIWRSPTEETLTLESNNFPPSLYGKGRINPTQNLVDAFPMANGYPITDSRSGYDANNPYENRDPRLTLYIVYNGNTAGKDNTAITTRSDGTNNDALNKDKSVSTRTGYYMRKLLRQECNPNSSYNTKQKHYTARIRYTEIFLDYAEAANEAWGPTGTGSHSYSAYDVIKAIRQRAGVGADNGDAYLESIKTDKDKMRELIRNERRLELCFENHRFYDLRRWNVDLSALNESAKGVNITKNGETDVYTPITVEERMYKDYMIYGPIPYSEILKFSNLRQNKGW